MNLASVGRVSNQDIVDVKCDLCGASKSSLRYKLTNSNIVTCKVCQFSYLNPRVSSLILQEKIQQWADQDVVDSDRLAVAFNEDTIRMYRKYLSVMQEYLPQRKNVSFLDVGCATGTLIQEAMRLGWQAEGLEVGKASAEYVRSHLGAVVYNTSLYNYSGEDKNYDVITLLEVIEHLETPFDALRRINSWLAEDGLLLLSTPNFDSLYRRLHGSNWWVVNCEDEHIQFFTPVTMRSMLEKAGFEVLWQRNRGIDLFGIIRSFSSKQQQKTLSDQEHGYYSSRNFKMNIKAWLVKLHVIKLARVLMRMLDWLFSASWSPLFGYGEQLVVVARKRDGCI